jgi:hypothetical protein
MVTILVSSSSGALVVNSTASGARKRKKALPIESRVQKSVDAADPGAICFMASAVAPCRARKVTFHKQAFGRSLIHEGSSKPAAFKNPPFKANTKTESSVVTTSARAPQCRQYVKNAM